MRTNQWNLDWVRSNGFIFGLFFTVGLAFLFPQLGSRDGLLHPELLSNIGIAVILFLQGLSLPFEKLKEGLSNWPLHIIVQVFTFVLFPLVGFGLNSFVPALWPNEPSAVREGFLYLCVLPSAISTSVVLTSVAKGNTVGALFNAIVSNVLGVIFTPVLVHFLMQASGHSAPFGPLLLKIALLTLLPFGIGMVLHRGLQAWVYAHKPWFNRISQTIVLFIVYTAFCDSVENEIWTHFGIGLTLKVLFLVIALFGGMSLLIYAVCRIAQLNRRDAITAYFCSVKKAWLWVYP